MLKTFLVAAALTAGIGAISAAPATASTGPATGSGHAPATIQGYWERAGEFATWRDCNDDGKLYGGRYVCELSPLNRWVLFVWHD